MSDTLRDQLAIVRQRKITVDVVDGICRVLIAVLGGFAIIMLLDWFIELPWLIRAVLLAAELAVIGFLLMTRLILPAMDSPDEDDLALRVEQHAPTLGSRLIAAIQLTRADALSAGVSVSLVHALVQETECLTAPIDFRAVVQVDQLKRIAVIVAGCWTVSVAAMVYAGGNGIDLFERALLVPGVEVPRRTHVQLLTPNPMVVGMGEPLEIRARALGVVPAEGVISLWYQGEHDPLQMPIVADAGHAGEFAVTLSSVSQSLRYRIRLNDGQSDEGNVRAAVRPAITAMTLQQQFPAYTHLDPMPRAPGDLQLLAGSTLSCHVTASSALRSGRAVFRCKSGDVSDSLTASGRELNTESPLKVPTDASGLSIILVDADGLESADPVVYPITILPDRPPVVRVTYPQRKEQLSTALARLIVGVDARDDFALGHVRLCYHVLPPDAARMSPAITTGTIDFQLPGTPPQFTGRFPFDLAKLQPRPVEGGSVEWWLEAEDTNDVTGPGKVASDHYLTRIVSEAQVRADLYAQLSEHMAELKQTADTQKKDNTDLGALIQQVDK